MTPEDIISHLNMERLKRLIRLYRTSECLWNPQDPGYHSISVKEDAWRRITRRMKSGLTPDQVKLQVLGLRNYYSKECETIRQNQRKGYSYVPRHSYFEDLQFLSNLDFRETQESNLNIDQVKSLLGESFVLDDGTTINPSYPPNFSEATICDRAVSLSPCSSVSQNGYTFYKMVLEPEPQTNPTNEDFIRILTERPTSGTERWYPTEYCVQCNEDEGEDACAPSEGRGNRGGIFSLEGEQNNGSRPRATSRYQHQVECPCTPQNPDQSQNIQRRTGNQNRNVDPSRLQNPPQNNRRGNGNQNQDPCPCSSRNSHKRTSRVHQNDDIVDMGTLDCDVPTNHREIANDDWPGPRMCGQNRPKFRPRYRKVVPEECEKQPRCQSWKRNNEAICNRLKEQLARQEQLAKQEQQSCCCRNERAESGEDQLNVMLLKKSRNNGKPIDPARLVNTQPAVDQGYYNSGQPTYNNSQMNQDPQRCNVQGCQCINCTRSWAPPQANYYQPQQYDHNATNYPQSVPQPIQGQAYVEVDYCTGCARCEYPSQPAVYCINNNSPDMWVPAQSMAAAPNPAQMSMVPPMVAYQSGVDDQRNERSKKWNNQSYGRTSDIDIESVDSRENSRRQRSNNQKPKRRQSSDREDYDENPSQRTRQMKCDDAWCPANRRNQNKTRLFQRKSRRDDSVNSNQISNYEDRPSSKQGKSPTRSPKTGKVFQLQTDDSQHMPCPAFDHRDPKECPYSKCKPQEPKPEKREGRTGRRSDSSFSKPEYLDEEKPRSQRRDRSSREDNAYRERKPSPKARSRTQEKENATKPRKNSEEESPKSKRRNEEFCYDETCPFSNSSPRKVRDLSERPTRNSAEKRSSGNKPVQSQNFQRNNNGCNDNTCPYVNSFEDHLIANERARNQRGSFSKQENRSSGKARYDGPFDDDFDSDENGYRTKGYRNDNRGYDKYHEEHTENHNKYSRRDERNSLRNSNERYQREYRQENSYGNDKDIEDDCICEDCDSEDYDVDKTNPVRDTLEYEKSKKGSQNTNDNEIDDKEYPKSDNKNSYERQNKGNYDSEKKFSRTRGTDVYQSEVECLCSDDETKDKQNIKNNQKARNDKNVPYKNKDDGQERTRGTENDGDDCDCDYYDNDYEEYDNRNANRDEASSSNRGRKDKQNLDASGKDVNDDCDPDEYENTKFEKRSPNQKDEEENCMCVEPMITVPQKRNQAGTVCMALNALVEDALQKAKIPIAETKVSMESKDVKAKTREGTTGDNQKHSVKKNSAPKTGKSSRVQSRSNSPLRHSGTAKTQPGETTKRRTAARSGGQSCSNGRRPSQIAAKRNMDTNAAANSKLPFDLNSAAYFICKLQDEGNNQRYLLVVPKKPVGEPDGHRTGPGQGSVKQLHCPRQCSGFQNVSWVGSPTSSQPHLSQQSQPEEGLSVLGSFRVPPILASTALGIIKDHLHRRILQQDQYVRDEVPPPRKMRRTFLSRPISSRPRRPVLRPSHKSNAPILDENRTLLLTNNPFRNLLYDNDKPEVIVLHPPVPDFRPSKNSLSKDEVEVQHITVRSEDHIAIPTPPKPPAKPQRNVLR
ncbi:uncharacterized protein LOC108090247 [Drosophila ficusphila]|uniref:uncharacterized protein LOC108090247 n=1 Tax=Drosophila ficusphila TaxID=30025 RepID=UPI0007E6EC30|nr:uncharacterized protein LOC108090247 [Drosophila ficusphila]